MRREVQFLTLVEVIEIHKDQIALYGGGSGMRDIRLLESAIAMPCQTFGNSYLHKDLFEMASAYAYHISENQPFVDGNKRVGLASALVFLELNGISLNDANGRLLEAIRKVSTGKMDKQALSAVLRDVWRHHI